MSQLDAGQTRQEMGPATAEGLFLVRPPDLGPCPVCGSTLGRPITACPECRSPHHAECWTYNSGCAIYGCASRPSDPAQDPVDLSLRAEAARSASVAMVLVCVSMVMGLMVHRDHLRAHRSRCRDMARHLRTETPASALRPLAGGFVAGGMRDPFQWPVEMAAASSTAAGRSQRPVLGPSRGPALDVTHEVASQSGLFGPFRVRASDDGGRLSWRTRRHVPSCRLVLSRDASLRGVDRVIEASTHHGRRHHVDLSDLQPDTTYHALVLALDRGGPRGQSPVISFRTPSAQRDQ